MNVELTDILTINGTLGGFEAIKWSINFWVNRKTNARIEDAHADAEEFKALREYNEFLQKQLFCKNPEVKNLEDAELVIYLKQKLNRPMRVCGMVKNVGEPGGGPFLAYNSDGTISLQILESSQIDMNDPAKKEMFEKGTHFNPVDLVCAVRDYKGHKFDLVRFVDKATGFISYKSKNGKDLKALELPGLWNGIISTGVTGVGNATHFERN